MDFVLMLPTELSQLIFSFLPGEDLWNIFSVSHSWRKASNEDFLWSRLCLEFDIDVDLERYKSERNIAPDRCQYAKVWGAWRWGTIKNWEKNEYSEIALPGRRPSDLCFSSSGDCLAVSDGSRLNVFTKKNSEIVSLLNDHSGRDSIRSIEINKYYLVALRDKSAIVYRTSDYKPYFLINFVGGVLEIIKDFTLVNSCDYSSVEFILLHKHTLWLGKYLFLKSAVIIDLETGDYREVKFPWKCTLMSLNENIIARTDSKLAIYALTGEKCFEVEISDYTLLSTSKSVMALFTENLINVYNRHTGVKIREIKKSLFDFQINYKRDIIYGMSRKKNFCLNIQAISFLTGSTHWSIDLVGDYSSAVQPIFGKFLCYTCLHMNYWCLLDSKSGKRMYKRSLPKLNFILYLSDFFMVIQKPDNLLIRFY